MASFGELRRGEIVRMDGELYVVVGAEFRNPGNWRAMVQLKFKNIRNGANLERRFRPDDKVEVVYVDMREVEFLYSDQKSLHFMDVESYEEEEMPLEMLGDAVKYLLPNTRVQLRCFDKKPVSIELPNSVKHKIKETEPAIKGATAQAQYKPAITETGLRVTIPPFVNEGDTVEIDTRSGEYLGRVSSK
jgi:elongation factor P